LVKRLLLVLASDELWALTGVSNLQEWVRMSSFRFALLAVVIVSADTAFVSDSLDGTNPAGITSYASMDLHSLFLSFLAKVVHHQSLEGLSGV
jgi:hypothetical protein